MEKFTEDFLEAIEKYKENELDRQYEVMISNWAKHVVIQEKTSKNLEKTVVKNPQLEDVLLYARNQENPIFERKSCFFLAFTYYRKNYLFNDMKNLVNEFDGYVGFNFNSDPLLAHISLLNKVKICSFSDYEVILKTFEEKIDKPEFSGFVGYLNHYVEVCADYYEMNLEKRFTKEGLILCNRLERAYEASKFCCFKDPGYAKLYVNKGRILALLGKYAEAEMTIKDGIAKLEDDSYHSQTVASFLQCLNKIPSIVAFDKSFTTIMECEKKQKILNDVISKTKLDNLKSITLISTILAFLLGGIEAFSQISEYKIIGLVMMMYSGLCMTLVGIVNLIFTVIIGKEKGKRTAIIISAVIIVVGVAMFVLGYLI